jgi:hypothetical protein
MKLRSLIITFVTIAVTATCLSGCVVVPARGYYEGPSVGVYHSWGYDHDHDRR